MSSADERGAGTAALAVLLLTAAALLLRVVGIDYLLPHQLEPDHGVVRTAAWLDRPSDVTQESPFAGPSPIYPWLMARALQVLPGHSYPRIVAPDAPLEEKLAAASEPFVRTRLLAAFLSALAVPMTYLLARGVLGRASSLLATAFVAASVLLQNYGQQGRAHGAVAGLSVLAMVFVAAIPRAPTWRNYLLAGASAGLAMACLHTGGFVLPALLVAHLLSRERRNVVRPLAALGLVALCVALFYPSIHTLVPLSSEESFSTRVTERLRTLSPMWEGLTGIPGSLWGSEPVLTLTTLLGAAFLAVRPFQKPRPDRERLAAFLVIATFVATLLVFWATLFPFRPRYLTSLIPFLAVLAAYGAREAARIVRARAAAAVAVSIALLALPAYACVRLCWLRFRPDTASEAARWLERNADPEKASVALGYLVDVPILERHEDIEKIPDAVRSHWQRYQLRVGGSIGWTIHPLTLRSLYADKHIGAEEVRALLEEQAPDYVVLADRGPEARSMDDSEVAVRELYGEPLVRFPPRASRTDGGPHPAYDLGPDALPVILTADTWGFPMAIYGRRVNPR